MIFYIVITYYSGTELPAPFSTNELTSNNINDGGNNQNDILFNRGKAINFVIIKALYLLFPLFTKWFRPCHQ